MKKIFITSFLTSFVFLLISCKSGKTYELKMQLVEGDHFEQNMQMDMRMHYSVSGQPMNMNMGMDIASFFDVLKSTPDEKQLKLTYSRSKMTMDMGKMGGLANIDSMMDNASKKLVGKSITLILSKNNEIKDVIGNNLEADNSDPESKEMIKKMLSKEQVNSFFGLMFSLYPDKPVAIGDSWTRENKMNIGEFEMKVKTKYTLTAAGNGSATINVDGSIDGKGNMVNNSLEVNMKGTQKGNMTINLATGYLQQGKYNMLITADMEAGGQKVPMTMDANYNMYGK